MTNPNPNKQTVELNRTSLYWGLLLILCLRFFFQAIFLTKHIYRGELYVKHDNRTNSIMVRRNSGWNCSTWSFNHFLLWFIRWSWVFTLSSHNNATKHLVSATYNFLGGAQDRHTGFASNTSIAS